MTPDTSKLIEPDDEAHIVSAALLEFGTRTAMAAAQAAALAAGLFFVLGVMLYQWYPQAGLWVLIFGPLLSSHVFWAWQSLLNLSAIKKAREMPVWKRYRLDLLLKRVYVHLAQQKGAK